MEYILEGHSRENAVHDMLICLLPEEEHTRADCPSSQDWCRVSLEASLAVARVVRGGACTTGSCPFEAAADAEESKRQVSYAIKTALYHALLPHLDEAPAWGSLTGVKPAKPARLALAEGMGEAGAARWLEQRYFTAPSRAVLCVRAAQAALEAEGQMRPKEVQLYVGIPFCPAKCAYCSFVSNGTRKSGHLIEPYLKALHSEIFAAGEPISRNGLNIGSLYIGGGTPTILSSVQLDDLLSGLKASFDLKPCREITVEAGRPETIDAAKLEVMARHKVGRISINPQSMDDNVLAGVGRLHTAKDIEDIYHLARQTADFIINMDIIAGLPGDTDRGLIDSVSRVAALGPENITIHCLARKKGAPLRFGRHGKLKAETLDACYDILHHGGWQPYYLYRQKYIAGGLENVGFAKPGTASYYNICMMEELGDVLALGSGGVTKLCAGGGGRIERLSNPKYPREYIEGAARISDKKRSLAFFE